MRRREMAAVLVGCLMLAGCGREDPDKVTEEFIKLLQEIPTIVTPVTDEDTAKVAITKLDDLETRLKPVMDRLAKLRGTQADADRLEQKTKDGLTASGKATNDKLDALEQTNTKAATMVRERLAKLGESIQALSK